MKLLKYLKLSSNKLSPVVIVGFATSDTFDSLGLQVRNDTTWLPADANFAFYIFKIMCSSSDK